MQASVQNFLKKCLKEINKKLNKNNDRILK